MKYLTLVLFVFLASISTGCASYMESPNQRIFRNNTTDVVFQPFLFGKPFGGWSENGIKRDLLIHPRETVTLDFGWSVSDSVVMVEFVAYRATDMMYLGRTVVGLPFPPYDLQRPGAYGSNIYGAGGPIYWEPIVLQGYDPVRQVLPPYPR
jgi:hypothetical protein